MQRKICRFRDRRYESVGGLRRARPTRIEARTKNRNSEPRHDSTAPKGECDLGGLVDGYCSGTNQGGLGIIISGILYLVSY